MMRKVLLSFAVIGLAVASAKSYTVNLFQPSLAGNTNHRLLVNHFDFVLSRREFRKFFRELDCGQVGVASSAKAKLLHLRGDGFDDARMAEANLVNVVAVKIQQPPPLQIFDARALTAF